MSASFGLSSTSKISMGSPRLELDTGLLRVCGRTGFQVPAPAVMILIVGLRVAGRGPGS